MAPPAARKAWYAKTHLALAVAAKRIHDHDGLLLQLGSSAVS